MAIIKFNKNIEDKQNVVIENNEGQQKDQNNLEGVIREVDISTESLPVYTVESFLKSRAHIGHPTTQRKQELNNYIIGHRNKYDIINIEKSLPLLNRAIKFMESLTFNEKHKKNILFITSPADYDNAFEKLAIKYEQSSIKSKWVGGLLTNYQGILRSKEALVGLEKAVAFTQTFGIKNKKVLSDFNRAKYLDKVFHNIRFSNKPDAVFICDIHHSPDALKEANRLGIPVIAFVDTNCSIKGIDYPIITNDDSHMVFSFYAKLIDQYFVNCKKNLPL